jgi:hypothetical protein
MALLIQRHAPLKPTVYMSSSFLVLKQNLLNIMLRDNKLSS